MKRISAIVASALILSACSSDKASSEAASAQEENAVETEASATPSGESYTTESGLMVEMLRQGSGEHPQTGDIVRVHYTGMLKATGEKFDSSVDRGEPIQFPLGVGAVIPGWEEGIALLSKGAKAKLTIPADLAYGASGKGPIPPNSDLIFEVELVDFKPAPKPITHAVFSTRGLKAQTTPTGLQYYIIEKGNGPKVQKGSTATVHYYGYFKDSEEKFDSSYERGEPFSVQVGAGQVIPGWEEGLALLSVGDKAKFIIPYKLAYGDQGYPGVIPPKADLVFDVEVLEVN